MITFQLNSEPIKIKKLDDGTIEYKCDVCFFLTDSYTNLIKNSDRIIIYNPAGILIYVPPKGSIKEALMAHALVEEEANTIKEEEKDIAEVIDNSVVTSTIYDAKTGEILLK